MNIRTHANWAYSPSLSLSGIFFMAVIVSVIVSFISVSHVGAVSASDSKYQPPSAATAHQWGADFCGQFSSNTPGVGDMIWFTAPDGGSNISVFYGQDYVPVQIHASGQYCGGYDGSSSVSGYYNDDSSGRISGNIGYPAASAGSTYDTTGPGTLYIGGLGTGSYTVCLTVTTNYPGQAAVASPNACSTINITRLSPWTTSAQSQVGVGENQVPNVASWTAAPGDMLHWRHTISASNGTTPGLGFAVGKSGFNGSVVNPPGVWGNGAPANNNWPIATTSPISPGSPYVIGWQANYPDYSSYRVQMYDVGHKLCEYISWGPTDYTKQPSDPWSTTANLDGNGNPTSACVDVPYNFNLTPSIDPLGREFGDQSGTIPTVTARVKNDGPTKSYDDTKWQLSTIIVKPGGSIGGGPDSRQDGCAYYGNTCSSLSGSGPTFMPPDSTQVAQLVNQQIGDLEVGSQLCYGLSVMAYNQGLTNASGWWRHSAPQCVVIGKRPKAQVWGGDLMVGRRFNDDVTMPSASNVDVSTSTKDNGTKTFGSWIEYGIFAPGEITGGSAAGLAGPVGNASSSQSDWSKLTFANSGQTTDSGCTATGFGCYAKAGAMGIIPDVGTRLAPGKVTDTPQLPSSGALDNLSGAYYAVGDATITGGAIVKGKSVVIRAAGTVRITGDIRYTGDTLTSINDIPQVVIIANNIIIDEGVSNVDAWLIANGASGSIYTCGDFRAVLTSKVCDKQLTVNGPVMSKKLFLQRTAGSGTGAASGDPAEVLNLRADAYLWAISHSGGAGGIQTVDTHELAPRF